MSHRKLFGRCCHRSCASTIHLQAEVALELQISGCRTIGDDAVVFDRGGAIRKNSSYTKLPNTSRIDLGRGT